MTLLSSPWRTALLSLCVWAINGSALAATFTVSMDRTNYLVGETATYAITGATPNAHILWSSTKNGISTGETAVDYGQTTDANGNWTATAGASWDATELGLWVKQALINGATAQVSFYVSANLAGLTPGPATPARDMLGIDDWNGAYPAFHLTSESLLEEDARIIHNTHSQVILFPIGPQAVTDFPGLSLPGSVGNLTDLAKSAPYQNVFAMNFSTYVLTTYAYTDPDAFGSPNLAAEQQEIANFTAYLLTTYKGTGKTFILKNWEGEWAMSQYANGGTAVRPYTFSPQLLQRMTDWLNARHAGVVQGRAMAGAVSGVAVHDAAEFVWLTEGLQSKPGMLTSVIPNVQSDYITYSSYDTINRYWSLPTLRRGILDDLTWLRHYPGLNGRPLLIGEYGFSLQNALTDADQHMTIASQAFMDASIPLALYWVAADYANGFGIATPNNQRTSVWTAFRSFLAPQNNAVLVSSTVPTVMQSGQSATALIQLQNTGNVPWDNVNRYSLQTQNPAANTVWSSSGAFLTQTESVLPNATKPFLITLTAPITPGDYTLQLQMTQELSGAGTFGPLLSFPIHVVNNQPPVVSAGADQIIVLPSTAVLNGRMTDDGLVQPLSSTWTVISGSGVVTFATPNSMTTTAAFSQTGTYGLQLSAYDGQFVRASSSTVIVRALPVNQPPPVTNQPPVVSAGADFNVAWPATGTVYGRVTDDGLNRAVTTTWTPLYGPGIVTFTDASAPTTSVTFQNAGVYGLQLAANDGQYVVTSSVTVTVSSTAVAAIPPTISSVAPANAFVGDAGVALEIVGTHLLSGCTLYAGGAPLATRYASGGQINATLPATALTQAGTLSLTVINPDGTRSNALSFAVVPMPLTPTLVAGNLGGARVYPNPMRAATGDHDVTFDRIPNGSTIKIFTISGRWVTTLEAPDGTAVWGLTTDGGASAASGLYLYLITDPQGHISHGKLTLIR